MFIDSDFEGKVLTETRRFDIHHDPQPVRLLGNGVLVTLEDVQAKLAVNHSEDFLKVIVIVQVLPLRDEPEAVTAFSAVTKVNEKVSPAGLAEVEVAAGLGVSIERVLEFYPCHNLAAKIVLEDLQASVRRLKDVASVLLVRWERTGSTSIAYCFVILAK